MGFRGLLYLMFHESTSTEDQFLAKRYIVFEWDDRTQFQLQLSKHRLTGAFCSQILVHYILHVDIFVTVSYNYNELHEVGCFETGRCKDGNN